MKLKIQDKLALFSCLLVSCLFAAVYYYIDWHVRQDPLATSYLSDLSKSLPPLFFVLTILFVIAVRLLVSIIYVRPVETLIRASRDRAGGNLKTKVNLKSADQMEELAETINDIAEQIKKQVAQLTMTNSRLEAVFLSMFEGVMVVDAEGRILLMNQSLKDFCEVKGRVTGRKPLEIIRNVDIQSLVDKVLTMKTGLESHEISVLVPEEKILFVHATPVILEGQLDGAVLVFHDITQLRHLERVRRDFVANVSHELRTPVATIKGYAETLLDGALEDKENAKDFIQIIHTDAERLARLVNDLLDLSRIESGKMSLVLDAHALEPILERVLGLLQKLIQANRVTIIKKIPDDLPKIRVDELSIAQVFLNLIENAIKYNRPQGKITISAEEAGAWIKISIADTGIGIPPEELPRVFERFYRVDKAHSRQLSGTGLGLSIVKHLVQAHHGDIHVESRVGFGTTFFLTLPKG